MNDLPFHLFLFVLAGSVIVVIGTFFAESEDRAALKALPRRLTTFFLGSALVAVVMLICEHTFASIH